MNLLKCCEICFFCGELLSIAYNKSFDYYKDIYAKIQEFYYNMIKIIGNVSIYNNTDNIDYFRLLNGDYTVGRIEDDKKSIENCKNSDENYFSILVKGDKFKFDKYVDERDSVSNNNL